MIAAHALRDTDLELPNASEVIGAAGCSRDAAYAVRRHLLEALPALVRRRGRPPRADAESATDEASSAALRVQGAVLDYLLRHPGSASQGEHRRRYSDGFRQHVLELAQQYVDVPLPAFADAARVPLGTLKDWLAGGRDAVERGLDTPNTANAAIRHEKVTHPRLLDVLRAYKAWKGSFLDFCAHVRHHRRIPFGRALIANLLQAEGLRTPSRRPARRDPDAEALRGRFETFFAWAQGVADGTAIQVRVGEASFTFNVELVVDTHTAAWTGLAVTPTEDADALLAALDDAHETTGAHPDALLVDGKPSNHAPEILDALAAHDTILIRATPSRAENKAHVEGAFGLFKDRCPELVLDPTDPAALARQLVEHVVVTFARALNHRPRPQRAGQSRVAQFEQDKPTEEERARAREALRLRAQQQERARQRAAKALDPAVRQHLVDAFVALGLDDPDERFRIAIARYPADAVAAGLAIFRAKQQRGTLPDGVDARYLLGIVRNVHLEDEGYALADAIWRERLAMRDRALLHLDQEREQLELDADQTETLLMGIVDRAMAADRQIDRAFWLRAAADLLLEEAVPARTALFRMAARRVHACHAVAHRHRLAATRRLAAMALGLAEPNA